MTHPALIRIFTRLLDCGREEIRLWFLTRALDPHGSAKVCVTVQQLMAFFGIGRAAVYRWLKRGEGVLWRRNRQVRAHIELHLVGVRQVCKNLQLGLHKNVLGAISEVPLDALATRFGSKAMATYLDALQCQQQAWYQASQAAPESIRHFVLKPWERISSVTSTGDTVGNKAAKQIDRYAFESNGWTIPGTSISGIRKKTDWKSDRTIQRRLSDKCRAEHGLEPLNKRRVAEEVTDPNMMALLAQSSSGYLVDGSRVYKVLTHTNHEFFALKHNIYGQEFRLWGLRRLRGKVNQFIGSATNDINTGQK